MSVIVKIISAVVKSAVGENIENKLVKDAVGISIDGITERGVGRIDSFINAEKSKLKHILSKGNMEAMGIPEDDADYVVAELKDLLKEMEVTDAALRQSRYDSMNLCNALWDEYCKCRGHKHIECESHIKKGLYSVSEAIIELARESKDFEKDFLVHISNSVDDAKVELQNISVYMRENFNKLDDNSQIVLNILLAILDQVKKINMQNNETKNNNKEEKFQNNKKQKYIETWNGRLFLHIDNDERPITLADAFIMPYYIKHKYVKRIGFYVDDALDEVIEKFIKYDKTCTMLITGVPGIGKSSITSWIANRYKADDNVIILRFRDWEYEELNSGLLKTIYNTLACNKKELENKILVLDGFDEIKALDRRDNLLGTFISNMKDFENFKCIITSRPAYINLRYFDNVFELKEFDIGRIEKFYNTITGTDLKEKVMIVNNREVLGIPVILYMAVMSKVDISENFTKVELYNRIFAETGGIFDRFSYEGTGYSSGEQILRKLENTKKYLRFLRKVAFRMFEKGILSLKTGEYKVPKLESENGAVSILEFPIKHLFENVGTNIEFIHKSIYEYFVSEYIFESLRNGIISNDIKTFAGILGDLLRFEIPSSEIIRFLEYKIKHSSLNKSFDKVNDVFQLMLMNGMTYYVENRYKSVLKCEVNIFRNMLEVLDCWNGGISYSEELFYYITNVNCEFINLAKANLAKANLTGINLKRANLVLAILEGANLKNADLAEADLVGANLKNANLKNANLVEADLRGADLRGANLKDAKINGVDIDDSLWDNSDIAEVTSKLRDAKFTYIIIENDQGERKEVCRNELFPNEK